MASGGGRDARRRCSIQASAARAWALGAILALAIASFAAADGNAPAAEAVADGDAPALEAVSTTPAAEAVETVRAMMKKPFYIAELRSAI
jgi:hypothetical protein